MTSNVAVRILTHNIRYATTNPFPGEAPWSIRGPHLISELRFHTLHSPNSFICLQEVLHSQLSDILNGLNNPSTPFPRPSASSSFPSSNDNDCPPEPEWAYIGCGRDDGEQAGEYSPIIYRPSVWTVQHQTTRWLSPTPDTPSRGWDAASIRIVTIATFEHRGTGRKILALNTHLDDQGSMSRYESARLVARWVREYLNRGGRDCLDVFLTGDLNSQPNDEAYQFLSSEESLVRDVRNLVPEGQWYGHCDTFTGFDDGVQEPKKRIDFIFLGEEGRWRPVMYSVLENRARGMYVSDHRAVVADAVLEDGGALVSAE